jgi:asparagine synthase (glutamine-hydrolysing)
MCGIGGILGPDAGLDGAALLAALRHRGPDAQGDARPAPDVWLAATRLAINDLSPAGNQPMRTADGALVVVHNGEIYNAPALRDQLGARGHQFGSRCDTEVLLHGYREWGDQLVDHIEGMFAFALWDGPRRRALLARDPLGIKPLWLARRGSTLVFASEVRALIAAGAAGRSLSLDAVGSFLATGSVAEPHAIVRGVESLAPGHLLVVDEKIGTARKYWSVPEPHPDATFDEARREVRTRLEQSVSGCLLADVPVGLLLSGGIDSAALGLLARGRGQIETFHVRIGTASADRARDVAYALGTQHHAIELGPGEAEQAASAGLRAQDQPSVDGLNTFLVAGAIHKAGLKAAITGLGADELFLGYPLHRTFLRMRSLKRRLDRAAAPFEHLAAAVARLPWGSWRLEKALELIAAGGAGDTYAAARALFPRAWLRRLAPDAATATVDDGDDPTGLELSNYLLNTLLRDADVMSMAHGVELRVPMLDRRLVEAVAHLPPERRLERGVQKPLLVGAVPELPPTVKQAPKEGFELPLERWLLGPLRTAVEETLMSTSGPVRCGLDPDKVRTVWRRFVLRGDRASAHRVWALYALVTWATAHAATV